MENLSSTKADPDAQKVEDRWCKGPHTLLTGPRPHQYGAFGTAALGDPVSLPWAPSAFAPRVHPGPWLQLSAEVLIV